MAVWQYAKFTHTPFPYADYAKKYVEFVAQYAENAKFYARKYDNIAIWQYGNMQNSHILS
jgi:hypothetical protein